MRFDPDALLMITGGSGGIAQAVATAARAVGLPHVLLSRRLDPATEPDRLTLRADATDAAGVAAALTAAADHFGRPPSLLCQAAGALRLGTAERTSDEAWRETLSANLDSSFVSLRAWLTALGARPGAAVLFSSAAARMGTPGHVAVAAAKAGVEGLVRAVAADVANRGIRINALAPGLTDTPLARGFLGTERGRQGATAQYPLGRVGDPAETAAQALWLLSRDSDFLTGQVIALDGGFSAIRPLVRS